MGIISLEKSDRLFWLGRYSERVFTTLLTFFKYFDKMLDTDDWAYEDFCRRLNIPNIYTDKDDFIHKYLFTEEDPNSVYNNLLRAYDNGVILRDEISSRTLSYLQMSLDCIIQTEKATQDPLIYNLQPIIDYLFAFWGCLDDNVEDEECRNIIKCGRYLERLDLFMRLEYPYPALEREYNKFLNRLGKVRIGYNLASVHKLAEILSLRDGWKDRYYEALEAVWTVF